ncbi:MAG: AbrB/MazE/SpoVT family DNA-binding domain-containing protein [Clostridia bacterium]|nr:AbrB/MazE/SpoVT family DNA-binding domain-containing protein [Clostridia bacterium]
MTAENNGKYIFGVCKVGERGQIVIPKDARKLFNIKAGDSLLLLGDEKKGLALLKTEVFTSHMDDTFKDL